MIIKKEKVFFVFFIVAFILYLLFQSWHIFFSSNIEYNYKNLTYTEKNKIIFKGVANHLKDLKINNEKTYLDLDGEFSKEIYLFDGLNEIRLEYVNDFNKKTRENILIYKKYDY